jgi:hypothetical protein
VFVAGTLRSIGELLPAVLSDDLAAAVPTAAAEVWWLSSVSLSSLLE